MEEDIFSVNADLTALRELEETLKENPDKEWLEYEGEKWIKEDYVIPKSLVKEKIEELNKTILEYEEYRKAGKETDVEFYDFIANSAIIEFLQDLLGEE